MKTAITGGIGSGKSYVCRLLKQQGIEIYDCDAAAKRLMRTSETLRQQLMALIGPDTYTCDNGQWRLNKAAVAQYLLQSEANARAIDAIVHPAVANDFEQSGMQWMECAILFESGFDRLVDRVIAVTADDEVRIRRIMARDHITADEARQWLSRQLPQEQVAKRADFVIRNNGDDDLQEQLSHLFTRNSTIGEADNSQLNIQNSKHKMQTILAIAGKPGLYKLISRAKNNLVVEALDDTHRRLPAFNTDRITSLADIAMFTDGDDVPLMDVLDSLKTLEEGKAASLDPKKADSDQLREYFAKVLPTFDRERVHISDIKKLLQWYNILVANGITDFKEEMKPTEGDNIDDRLSE